VQYQAKYLSQNMVLKLFRSILTEASWGLMGGSSSGEASPVLWRKSQL